MTRKTDGPKDSPTRPGPPLGSHELRRNGTNVVSMTTSPAFDQWLDLQTKKLFEASAAEPDAALLELIRTWSSKAPN
ncbi:MAG: hypothetical protein JNL25_07220 [Rhodospirillaceae bacterium]|nr:hypothetical protein [Rhodospirillaceae bacterium]